MRRLRRDRLELIRRANKVEMEAGDRQRQRRIEIVAEAAEIGRQHDLQLRQRVSEGRVGLAKRVPSRIVEIEHEAGLVDLHPFGAVRAEAPTQHIDIDRQQSRQQRQRIEPRVLALAELQIGDRAEQHRPRLIAERFRLAILIDRLQRGQLESLPVHKLRHHVVVIGVEPFGHLLCRRVVGVTIAMMAMCARLIVIFPLDPARHCEIGRKREWLRPSSRRSPGSRQP